MFASRSRPAAFFFVLDMPLFKKTSFSYFLSFVVNIWSIVDNVCQHLSIYGTAYLPTARYCVLYGTVYLPTRTVRNYNKTVRHCFTYSVKKSNIIEPNKLVSMPILTSHFIY